jgi:CBS domain containing-hemolysin-like protein
MTPRTVVFSVPESTTVDAFFQQHEGVRFSRIPIYGDDPDDVDGFVLRGDLLLSQAGEDSAKTLRDHKREMPVMPESKSLSQAFNDILRTRAQIVQVVDEYGDLAGILTLEDIIETLLGLEIVDEGDEAVDMQEHARKLWAKRARNMGLKLED